MKFNNKLKPLSKIIAASLCVSAISNVALAADESLSSTGGVINVSNENSAGSEGANNAFDSDHYTKWLAFDNTAWLAYQLDKTAKITSYSITSANDAPSRDPSNWLLQGSNDGVHWSDIDNQQAQTFSGRQQTKSYTVSHQTAFEHFRLNITQNSGDSYIQIAELSLTGHYAVNPSVPDNTSVLTDIDSGMVTFSNQIHAGEGAINLFDDLESSKWLAQSPSAWVAYEFTKNAIISGYNLTSANDAQDRDPKNWTLEGSNDGSQWSTLDRQTNQRFANRYSTNRYQLNNSQSFSFYRLNISSNQGANYTQLAELELVGVFSENQLPPLEANFTAQPSNIFAGDQVQYTAPDNMDSYTWRFEGGSPSESTAQNPTVFYAQSGYFDTSLTLVKGNQTDSHLKPQFIVVSEKPTTNIDITSDSGVMQSQYGSTISGEGLNELTDDILTTKYVVQSGSSWVEHKGDQNYIVNGYSITSANDGPPRDPQEWTFEGSNDGVNFTVLDSQRNQDWSSRTQTREFSFNNNTAYRYHRFNFTNHGIDQWGYDVLQIAELAILGYGTGGEYPTAVMNFKTTVTEGDSVILSSVGSKNAASLLWQVQGQASSNQASPSYTFNQSGNYAVSLTVTTTQGEVDVATGTIRVNKAGSGNGNFVAPTINFIDDDPSHPGSIIFKQMVPDPVSFIQQHSETLAELIYDDVTPSLINNVENITYRLHDYDGISGKSGKTPNINIDLSSRYIANKAQELGGETAAILAEIRGVLYHELTHGYQWEPVGAGGYAPGTEFYGFIEGLADYDRITLGFHSEAIAKKGGSHTGGYTTTAFFYVWLAQAYNIDRFGAKLNATAATISPWTLEKALQKIFTNEGLPTKTVSTLWSEYQNSL
jgi:PKD repeat protein